MSTTRTQSSRNQRDVGMTLTEVLVAVVLTGLLSSVVAAAIMVVLRSEGGVARAVGESHDIQQVVNYLPADVRTAPTTPASYSTSGAPACGSGTNVLSIDRSTGPDVSYVLTYSERGARLDRVVCDADGELERMNVADLLDRNARPAATADVVVVSGRVVEVALQIVQQGGRASTVVAVPRPTEGLADAHVVGGTCRSSDPLIETSGFLTFVEGDVRIEDDVQVYKAMGIGGTLSFDDGQIASHGGNDTYRPASVGLYVGAIDWASSSGTLTVEGSPNGHVVITGQTEGVDFDTSRNGPITYLRSIGSRGEPQVEAQQGRLQAPNPGHTIQWASAFTELRSCSEAMAQLPAACEGCAVHVVPLHINARPGDLRPYLGAGDIRLDLTRGVTNVLNIGERRLAEIGDVTPAYLDDTPDRVDALVINVIDDDPSNNIDGRSVVELDDVMRFQNYTRNVIWNFAGIDEVRLPDGIWGTVFAPFSTVVVGDDLQGNLVAAHAVLEDGVINEDRSFEGDIRWN